MQPGNRLSALLTAVLGLGASLPAQWLNYPTPGTPRLPNGKPNLTAPVPRRFGQPDLSGVWFIDEYRRTILPNDDPPFQPWAKALFEKRGYDNLHHDPDVSVDPTERCIPPGIPRTMLQPFPWEIIQARDRIVMIFEYQSLVRQIFMDGRGHPKDWEPSYMGHSIGKFEGNTLVVDTTGFNDAEIIDPRGRLDGAIIGRCIQY